MKNQAGALIWDSSKYGTYVKKWFGEIGTGAIPPTKQQLKNKQLVIDRYNKLLNKNQGQLPPATPPPKPNLWQRILKAIKRMINGFNGKLWIKYLLK